MSERAAKVKDVPLALVQGGRGEREEETRELDEPVAASPAMRRVFELTEKVAASSIPVLILGETGTGKEVVARFLHAKSPRRGRPFIPLNCAALPDSLAESELFGHVRGAFTGADREHRGVFEQADGGTLFLDEIGDLPLSVQAKLLRTLDDGVVRRVGAERPTRVDARLVCATNRDMAADVTTGRFRADLFHRIRGVTISVPPLRERPEDVEPLARRFLADASRERSRPPRLTAETIGWLQRYRWPGNVRELRQAVHRAVAVGGDVLDPADFGLDESIGPTPPSALDEYLPGKTWTIIERDVLAAALRRHGSAGGAAKALRLSRATVFRKIATYGLRVESAGE